MEREWMRENKNHLRKSLAITFTQNTDNFASKATRPIDSLICIFPCILAWNVCSFFYVLSLYLCVCVSVPLSLCVFFLLRFMIQVLLLGHSWNATDKLLVFRCRCQMQVNRRNAGRTGKWTLCRNFHISADLSSCHALEINRNTCVCVFALCICIASE